MARRAHGSVPRDRLLSSPVRGRGGFESIGVASPSASRPFVRGGAAASAAVVNFDPPPLSPPRPAASPRLGKTVASSK